MSRKLDDSHFSFKCPMDFDAMEATEGGRYCNKCRKEVFDLTNCSLDEVAALQKKHGNICGFIQLAAAAAALSTAACENKPMITGGVIITPPPISAPGATSHPQPQNTPEQGNSVPR